MACPLSFVEWFLQLPEPWAWAMLFIVLLGEMGMVLHFLPTELIMVLGTVRLAHNPAELAVVIVVATFASAVGALLPYALGRYGGRPLLLRFATLLHLTPARLDRFDAVFRHPSGKGLVLGCRLIPGLRTAPSIPAGLAKMEPPSFLLLTTIGCGAFNTVFAIVAYKYGQAALVALEDWTRGTLTLLWAQRLAVLLAMVVLVIGFVVTHWHWRNSRLVREVTKAAGATTEDQGEEPRPLPEFDPDDPVVDSYR